MTAKYRANAKSSPQACALRFPQLTAILAAFWAKTIPTWRVNRSTRLCIAVWSLSIMAVTTLANLLLFILSTYRTVRSIMPRSRWFRALYQTLCLWAKSLIFRRLEILGAEDVCWELLFGFARCRANAVLPNLPTAHRFLVLLPYPQI